MKKAFVELDRGWQPTRIFFCPSRKVWDAEMKRRGLEQEFLDCPASCTTFPEFGVVITMRKCDRSSVEIIGLLAHEAWHAVEGVIRNMRDDSPSEEFKCYAMQAVLQDLVVAYEQCHGKITA